MPSSTQTVQPPQLLDRLCAALTTRGNEALEPETLRLNGNSIVSTTTPSIVLYTLSHSILEVNSKCTAPVLLVREKTALKLKVRLYNLIHAPPAPDSEPECYLAANDKLNVTNGNIALKAQPRYLPGAGKPHLHALLSRRRFWHHKVKFVKSQQVILRMRQRAHGYDYYETNPTPLPVAHEQVLEHGERRLVILRVMDQKHRDALAAVVSGSLAQDGPDLRPEAL